MPEAKTQPRLLLSLATYFSVLTAIMVLVVVIVPEALQSLPIAGRDAFDIAASTVEQAPAGRSGPDLLYDDQRATIVSRTEALAMIASLGVCLLLTVALMIPVTWTYMATRQEAGFRKTFVRVLIALPICATTIVLLIQNSLALAFGLAALVAAVRFRVSLQDPIDGVYIFAAICVGLSAGIGFMGISTIMVMFFCLINALLWHIDFGHNPVDDARAAKDLAKLQLKSGAQD